MDARVSNEVNYAASAREPGQSAWHWDRPVDVSIENVARMFGTTPALHGVSLGIDGGELVALLGPSGSGKTTLLRILAGLDVPTSGRVLFDGEDALRLTVQQRNVGLVFQNYALFRHMTVLDNIGFGLSVRPRSRRPSRKEIRKRALELLDLVQLSGLEKRFPSQLSGGQRQRVALARALAVEPKVLLLDEPFGALDAKVRKELRRWLRQLHDEIHITTLFVTHDQEEALEVADRVAILRDGKIEQIGTPEEIYDHPASPFVYDFLGNVNLFSGRVQDGSMVIGETEFTLKEKTGEQGANAVAFVRPHDIRVTRTANGPALAALVVRGNAAGPLANLELKRADSGELFTVQLTKEQYQELQPKAGEQVFVELRNVRVFSDDYSI